MTGAEQRKRIVGIISKHPKGLDKKHFVHSRKTQQLLTKYEKEGFVYSIGSKYFYAGGMII